MNTKFKYMDFTVPLVHKQNLGVKCFCHYEIFDKEGKSLNKIYFGACHSQIKGSPYLVKDTYVLLYIDKNVIRYSLEDLKKWLKFLKTIGFKASFLEEKHIENKPRYGEGINSEFYLVKLEMNHYLNKLHMYAAIVAVRYIYYEYSGRFTNIPERTFQIKSIYGRNISNLKALVLAYYSLYCHEIGHAFIGCAYNSYLQDLKSFKKALLRETQLNNCLTKNGIDPEYYAFADKETSELYNAKKYKEIAKKFNLKYKQ